MKRYLFRIALYLGLALTFASCSKDNYQEDLLPLNNEPQQESKVTLDLSVGVTPLDVIDYTQTGDDDLRATYGYVYSKSLGYGNVPHLFVKENELGKNSKSLTIRMGIINVDNGKVFYQKNKTKINSDQGAMGAPNNKPSWYLEGDEDNGQRLHTYLRYDNSELIEGLNLNDESCYAFIGLGGYSKSKTQLDFNKSGKRDNSPNVQVYAVKNGDIEGRYIPMMTAVTKLSVTETGSNKVVHFSGNNNFKPRGSFIGVRLDNKLGKRATIQSIKVVDADETPFYYRGSFEWDFAKEISTTEKEQLKQKSSFYARFNGVKKKGDEVFPVKLPDEQPYILGTEALSDDSRTIYLWGYQREDRMGKSFKFKVIYTLEGSTEEVESKLISIKPPKNGFFKDGTAYRITVKLWDKDANSGGTTTEASDQKTDSELNGENLLDNDITSRWELPELEGGTYNYFVTHKTSDVTHYSVEYNVDKRHARWVAFKFDSTTAVNPAVKRKNKFKWLSNIPDTYKVNKDWYHSTVTVNPKTGKFITYDRGHLTSSEDRAYEQTANDLTFDYINMSPQLPNFNRGYYKQIEGLVQEWGQDRNFCDELYVVKGGTIRDGEVFDEKLKGIMVIPKHYFMALVAKKGTEYHGIALWIEHRKYTKSDKPPYKAITCSIDELEQKTGINFFCNIPDTIEEAVEAENADSYTWPSL